MPYVPHQFQEPEAPPIRPAPIPAPSPRPAAALNTWVPLREWAAAHHIGAPHRLSDMSVAEYAIGSKKGAMVLEIGSIEATWNDVIINLGFAPCNFTASCRFCASKSLLDNFSDHGSEYPRVTVEGIPVGV